MAILVLWMLTTFMIVIFGETSSTERDEKLLNIFNVIRFPNDACTTSANTNGVCYSASECRAKGGLSQGVCASSFGVCCAFIGSCGGTTRENNTYFSSSSGDTSPCMFSACKTREDICQIRLNFDGFDIAQPNTQVATTDNHVVGRTQCQSAQFVAASAGPASPTICGTNQGYHMILEASDDCNMLSFSWVTNASPNNWNIHIMQIPCDAKWKPPEGCLQYYTGSTGFIQSYNYAGGVHLANQDYNNCIRTERNFCSIQYSQVSATDFSLSSPVAATSQVGDDCIDDYVVIQGGGSTNIIPGNFDRFCGSFLATISANGAATTVFSQRMPFAVGVVTDGAEIDLAAAAEASAGFYMYYNQVAC